MVWKRILAAVTVLLVVAAIVLAKKKAKQMSVNPAKPEIKK